MAKELPYFRFYPGEWQNGSISLEDYDVQGIFINICCFYWLQDCSITLALLQKKFRNDTDMIELLISNGIIKHDSNTDLLEISFLNEQFDLLSTKRKARQEAGRKGGKQKRSNAKAMLKQNGSYKDKDKDKDKDNTGDVEKNEPPTDQTQKYTPPVAPTPKNQKNEIALDEKFIEWWPKYKNHSEAKSKVYALWKKLKEEEKKIIMAGTENYSNSVSEPKFMKHMTTFLRSRMWEAEDWGKKQEIKEVQPTSPVSTKQWVW